MKCRAIFNASSHVFKFSNLYHFGTEISRNRQRNEPLSLSLSPEARAAATDATWASQLSKEEKPRL